MPEDDLPEDDDPDGCRENDEDIVIAFDPVDAIE